MEKGRVVETGTHQQLIKSRGVYAKMWEAQNGEALDQQSAEKGKIKINYFCYKKFNLQLCDFKMISSHCLSLSRSRIYET